MRAARAEIGIPSPTRVGAPPGLAANLSSAGQPFTTEGKMTRRILPDLTQYQLEADAPKRPDDDIAACDELLARLHKWHGDHAPKEKNDDARSARF